jgi:IgA Peptidase M64
MSTSDGTVLGTTQIFGSAPRKRAFNIVMLAEGFTNAQQNDFNNACNAFVTAFRAVPPYDELSPAINVFRVNVASTDSGADDPASTGGTGATARTYFDATFGANGIRRLLVCNNTTALTVAAAQLPEFTVVLVVVNSTVYGGSGRLGRDVLTCVWRDGDCYPRDGSHCIWAGGRVRVLCRRE